MRTLWHSVDTLAFLSRWEISLSFESGFFKRININVLERRKMDSEFTIECLTQQWESTNAAIENRNELFRVGCINSRLIICIVDHGWYAFWSSQKLVSMVHATVEVNRKLQSRCDRLDRENSNLDVLLKDANARYEGQEQQLVMLMIESLPIDPFWLSTGTNTVCDGSYWWWYHQGMTNWSRISRMNAPNRIVLWFVCSRGHWRWKKGCWSSVFTC